MANYGATAAVDSAMGGSGVADLDCELVAMSPRQ